MISQFYPYEYADSVFFIDYNKLYNKGFRGIIFDIDNTLVHHGDDSTHEVDELFKEIHRAGLKTVLLTNNEENRVKRFIRNIDTMYICDADKPNTQGYLKAVDMMGIKKEQTVFIGDQIFTDILGANRSGIASILVKFIKLKEEKRIGKRRYAEYLILELWKKSNKYYNRLGDIYKERSNKNMTQKKQRKLFCEICPLTYAISEAKEMFLHDLKDIKNGIRFADTKSKKKLPNIIASQSSGLIKRGKGIDPVLQENKAVNIKLASAKINGIIIRPGETFSFWRTVGKITKKKGYLDGRIISGNKLTPGLGGGLCNLGNTIHRLILHGPLEVTEFHSHSDALAPDEGKRVPFSSGTSVYYNYIDYRFKNNTDHNVQLLAWCKDDKLYCQLRSEVPTPYNYNLAEENHHFHKDGDKYYRISKIYKITTDKKTGKIIEKKLVRDNHSEVMYDYSLIPKELIR